MGKQEAICFSGVSEQDEEYYGSLGTEEVLSIAYLSLGMTIHILAKALNL